MASIRLIFSVLLVLMLRGNEEIAKIVTQVTENLSRAETWAQLIQKEEFVLFAEQVAKAARDLDRGEMMIVPAKVAVLPEDAEEWAMILVQGGDYRVCVISADCMLHRPDLQGTEVRVPLVVRVSQAARVLSPAFWYLVARGTEKRDVSVTEALAAAAAEVPNPIRSHDQSNC